jgi:hypothetical protein
MWATLSSTPSQRRRAPSLHRRKGLMPSTVPPCVSWAESTEPRASHFFVQKSARELSRSASYSSASTEHWDDIGERPIATMCDRDTHFDPRQLWMDCAELPTRIAPCCTELSRSPALRTAAALWDETALEWPNEWPLHRSGSEACHGCTPRTESTHRRTAEEGAANATMRWSYPPQEQQGA